MKKILIAWHRFWYSYHAKQLHKLGVDLTDLIPLEVLSDFTQAIVASASRKID